MSKLLVAQNENDNESKTFLPTQLEEAKQWLHKEYTKVSAERPDLESEYFFIEELQAGFDTRQIYTYDKEDFYSPLTQHNIPYVKDFIHEGFIDESMEHKFLLFLQNSKWLIKELHTNVEELSDGTIIETLSTSIKKEQSIKKRKVDTEVVTFEGLTPNPL